MIARTFLALLIPIIPINKDISIEDVPNSWGIKGKENGDEEKGSKGACNTPSFGH